MKRWIFILLFFVCAGVAAAGEFANDVRDLADQSKRSAAIERLAKAGMDAFDDLTEGLGLDPFEEDVRADEAARRSQIRQECARLIGHLGDTRPTARLLELAGEHERDGAMAGIAADALGRIWAGRDATPQRRQVSVALSDLAGEATAPVVTRWGALRGLARMREGAQVARTLLDESAPALLRGAAVEVLAAAGDRTAAAPLLAIWQSQREGQSSDYAKPLGVRALFAAATLGAGEAVDGLVDVATMSEFARYQATRGEAVRLMRVGALRGPSIARLVSVLKDSDRPAQHRETARTLGEFGVDGVKAYLAIAREKPTDDRPEEYFRDLVDRYLSALDSDEALAAFVSAFREVPAGEVDLREKILDQLLNHRDKLKEDGVNLLRAAAEDGGLSAAKRAQCVGAYADLRGRESLEDLKRWAASESPEVRAQAVLNLGRAYIPLQLSKPVLMEAVASRGEEFASTRVNALKGLQRSDDRELLSVFLDSLDPEKEPSGGVRAEAITALNEWRRNTRVRDDEVFPALSARMGDPDPAVRAQAVRVGVMTARRMGNGEAAAGMVRQALGDDAEAVRERGWDLVPEVGAEVDDELVFNAALREDTPGMQGQAIRALARSGKLGEGETRGKLIELAFRVLDGELFEQDAVDYLKRAGEGTHFAAVSEKVRDRVERLADGDRRDQDKIAALIDILIGIQDDVFSRRVKELAELPSARLRRKCVDYFVEFGTREDVAWLRQLRDRTDAPAAALRSHIEDAISVLQGR